MRLRLLLDEAEIFDKTTANDMEITGICSDSRHVAEGNLFVALRGLHSDGAAHVGEAVARGASFVVSERPVTGVPFLAVPDARRALALLWDAWYGHPARGMTLIGITGTNGKTSTAFMLAAILRLAGYSAAVVGTVSTDGQGRPLSLAAENPLANMTTPDPAVLYAHLARLREEGVTHAVMEVTSHALFFGKAAPLCFARAAFTNLTPDHLDFHGDMTSYYMAKRLLFSQCEQAVISLFNPYGQQLADSLEIPFLTVGRQNVSDVRAGGDRGVSFTLRTAERALYLTLPIPGDFSVENAALAAMLAVSLSIEGGVIARALREFRGVPGRMERVAENSLDISVFIDYAHTPDALEKLLLTARDLVQKGGRTVVLFGCGGDRDRTKRAVMGEIAARLADHVIITSDNSRSEDPMQIICQIVSGIPPQKAYTVIPDRASAIRHAIENAKAGDLILLAGKGHEEYEIVGGERRPFCEGRLVKEAFRSRLRTQNGEDENKGEPTV